MNDIQLYYLCVLGKRNLEVEGTWKAPDRFDLFYRWENFGLEKGD